MSRQRCRWCGTAIIPRLLPLVSEAMKYLAGFVAFFGPILGAIAWFTWPYWWVKILAVLPFLYWLYAIFDEAVVSLRGHGGAGNSNDWFTPNARHQRTRNHPALLCSSTQQAPLCPLLCRTTTGITR